jgi:hypothetical protein
VKTCILTKWTTQTTLIRVKIYGSQVRGFGRVCSSGSTPRTRRVTLVTNPVISHECGKDPDAIKISGTYG